MNFSDVLKALNQASAFELYRMRAAIDRVLDEPRWLLSIQSRLRVGQSVEYFDPQANTLRHGQILEMRRKQAVVLLDRDDGRRWLISMFIAIPAGMGTTFLSSSWFSPLCTMATDDALSFRWCASQ